MAVFSITTSWSSARKAALAAAVVVILVVAAPYAMGHEGEVHSSVVGGSTGWQVPNTTVFYQNSFADMNDYLVGDVLVFNFKGGPFNVHLSDFVRKDVCNVSSSGLLVNSTGTNIQYNYTIAKPGPHVFISSIGDQCKKGMRFQITAEANKVEAPEPAPAPAPSQNPAPAPSPSSASSAFALSTLSVCYPLFVALVCLFCGVAVL